MSASIKRIEITGADVTANDIVNIACKIWTECEAVWSKVKLTTKGKGANAKVSMSESDNKQLDALYERMRTEYKDFATSYPTVLRHMIQDKWFNKKAFSDYMQEVAKSPWTNDQQRMDSYTRYAELLMRATSKEHLNLSKINAFRRDYRSRLQREHDSFMANFEKHKQEVETEKKRIDEKRLVDALSAFERLAKQLGVPDERISDQATLAKSGIIKLDKIEEAVVAMRRVIAGDSANVIQEEVRKQREEAAERAAATIRLTTQKLEKELQEETAKHAEEIAALQAETEEAEQARLRAEETAAPTTQETSNIAVDPDADIDVARVIGSARC